MAQEACPRCGGRARVEAESWTRDAGVITRSLRCESCGRGFRVRRGFRAGSPPWSRGTYRLRGLTWIPLFLLALWVFLRVLPYSDRAQLYAGVSSFLEAFQNPLWAAAISVVAVLLLVVGRRSAPAPVTTPVATDVHIREESDGRLAVLMSGPSGALGRDFLIVRNTEEERRICERLSELAERSFAFGTRSSGGGSDDSRELRREIYSIGLSLADTLLGTDGEVRDRLFDLPGDHLLLRVQPSLAHLPWELLVPRPGAQFLWQRFHVARQVRDEARGIAPARPTGGPIRMLLLADMESGVRERALPAAEAEAAELMELGATEPERLRIVRRSPRSQDELRRVLAEGFDVVHFASHTSDPEGNVGWVLADGRAVDPSPLVDASGTAPALVFANGCRSGPGARLSSWSSDAPRRLMAGGVSSYVGTLWEVEDERASALSRVFYRSVLAGASLGEAMSAARESQMGVSPFTWANYVLYGDPAARLQCGT